ncbi:polyprenyl synthetase family protein [Streptomyces armeniacus]|uniref:Polyprenyl synthetase family protein n=1 Tax=Streptomyces armeniacus TaxID=83291 RepID=A0A345XZ53_9ACTN|nr:polyprenyl synthetase family protein [Streptomyces armeniacus]AXK36919.1 polyprenyl synthetase family protein [Streptomyces armeniacus]
MTLTTTADGPDLDGVPAAVDVLLDGFFDRKAGRGRAPHLPHLVELLRAFTKGGKRLRPVLCARGWQAAGGGDPAAVLPAAASLELFHTFALIHDDVMDRSDTRRGRPTVHRLLAARARRHPHLLDAERFGDSGAILVGDLAMVWSDELFHDCGLPPERLAAARPFLDAMRGEVMHGQYLDVLSCTDFDSGLDAALNVIRYKTARYTVERPLQLGVALAGGGPPLLDACSAYGLPVGEAFQLRDDVIGVFGDPAVTGKSCLDDLREGKHTALLALALECADAAQARTLRALVGDPELDEEGAARIRSVLLSSGALDTVEHMITERRRRALRALEQAPFPAATRSALQQLAVDATERTS